MLFYEILTDSQGDEATINETGEILRLEWLNQPRGLPES